MDCKEKKIMVAHEKKNLTSFTVLLLLRKADFDSEHSAFVR